MAYQCFLIAQHGTEASGIQFRLERHKTSSLLFSVPLFKLHLAKLFVCFSANQFNTKTRKKAIIKTFLEGIVSAVVKQIKKHFLPLVFRFIRALMELFCFSFVSLTLFEFKAWMNHFASIICIIDCELLDYCKFLEEAHDLLLHQFANIILNDNHIINRIYNVSLFTVFLVK